MTLPEIARGLLDPSAYPEPPDRVELVQTQMSFVFMAGDLVYKVKKPVDLGYLDYSTLEKRLLYCRKEVELNRRLSPDVYLGVAPIVKGGRGFVVGGEGPAVEYAVKMRRLPREAMLDVLLAAGQVTPEMIGGVAQTLAAFHRQAETGPDVNRFGSLETIVQNADENFAQTEKYIGVTIPLPRFRGIKEYTGGFIKQNAGLFQLRVTEGRIRDCHGDLHAAHVCFYGDGIRIYDCIEFNDRFRYCDIASEVAFLAMDLDHYRRPDLSRHFVDEYVASSQDSELMKLIDFYKCYRAYVRGKVESFKWEDPHIPPEQKEGIRAVAGSYFELAESYIRN